VGILGLPQPVKLETCYMNYILKKYKPKNQEYRFIRPNAHLFENSIRGETQSRNLFDDEYQVLQRYTIKQFGNIEVTTII
jgi:hypothetical protein